MEFKGKIIAVPKPETGISQRGPWTRQTIVIEYESGQFPRTIAIQNTKDAENFGKLRVGQTGVFRVDCKAREFNGKYYNDLTCWSWTTDQQSGMDSNGPF